MAAEGVGDSDSGLDRQLEEVWLKTNQLNLPEQRSKVHSLLRSKHANERLLGLLLIRRLTEQIEKEEVFFELAGPLVYDPNNNCRWQATIVLSAYLHERSEEIWEVLQECGCDDDEDMRAAMATVLLEHLIDDVPGFRARAEELAKQNGNFKKTLRMCW